MPDIDGTPLVWLSFDSEGRLDDNPKPLHALHEAMQRVQATDVLVLSHGWKNTQAQAARLYQVIWRNARPHIPSSRRFVLAGIAWPSVAFPTDFDDRAGREAAGGALAAPLAGGPSDLDPRTFERILRQSLPGKENARLRSLARAAASDPSAETKAALAAELARRMQALAAGDDAELSDEAELIARRASSNPELLFQISAKPFVPRDGEDGGAAGGDGAGQVVRGPLASIARLANQFTYYPMKRRAGKVGRMLGGYLDPQPFLANTRLHLAGHSFGGRLVTACASQMKSLRPQSLTLLQAAFSHNGLAASSPAGPGYFADVLAEQRVRGPIAITHTHNDRACTFYYALASRLAGDGTMAIGDANDRYGAMGANGAQHVDALRHGGFPASSGHRPVAGRVNNYLADKVVVAVPGGTDAHNNIGNAGIGALLGSVVSL